MGKEGKHGLHKLCAFPLDGHVLEMTALFKKSSLQRLTLLGLNFR
jgi:hypothetical protein